MLKIFKVILLIAVLGLALFFIKDNIGRDVSQPEKSFSREEKQVLAEGVGEKIIYDVRLGNLKLGKSTFTHMPAAEVNGRLLVVMVFETSLARFKDLETIYADPQTMLPVRVERDVLNWFSREKIIEDYDQQEFTVKISKKKGAKTQDFTIKKDSPIHNAILLPQQIRRLAKLDAGESLTANLPNRQYVIKLVATEDIKVPAGTFKAYHFQSTPNHIDIWISADERRIPLKIQSNSVAFGYLMVLKEYLPA